MESPKGFTSDTFKMKSGVQGELSGPKLSSAPQTQFWGLTQCAPNGETAAKASRDSIPGEMSPSSLRTASTCCPQGVLPADVARLMFPANCCCPGVPIRLLTDRSSPRASHRNQCLSGICTERCLPEYCHFPLEFWNQWAIGNCQIDILCVLKMFAGLL